MSENIETYLGDGVYATLDGYQIWLDCRGQVRLSLGPSGTPSIALNSGTLNALTRFMRRLIAEAEEPVA
jgi:hypothetical protein